MSTQEHFCLLIHRCKQLQNKYFAVGKVIWDAVNLSVSLKIRKNFDKVSEFLMPRINIDFHAPTSKVKFIKFAIYISFNP